MKKSKDEVSISLNKDVLNYISENFTNRSKFIEYCIIQELIKENKFKEKIEKMIL
jgi:metal-responsive CopG/Arc/MetJ family transcriptional regulator